MKIFCFRWNLKVNHGALDVLSIASRMRGDLEQILRVGMGDTACCGQPWAMPLHGIAQNPGDCGACALICAKRRKLGSSTLAWQSIPFAPSASQTLCSSNSETEGHLDAQLHHLRGTMYLLPASQIYYTCHVRKKNDSCGI